MSNIKDTIEKEFDRIWPQTQKNIAKINKDVVKLLKKSEESFVSASKTVKKSIEKLVLKAKREELYYELGKNISTFLTSDQLKDKNILRISTEIQRVNKNLRTKKEGPTAL